jgi:hypothetical protein
MINFLTSVKMGYSEDHPYRAYEEEARDEISTDRNQSIEWNEAFRGAADLISLATIVPVYRTWLIVRDLIIQTPRDLISSDFTERSGKSGAVIPGKKLNRLIFNITSAFVLDPLYLLSGLVQSVAVVAVVVFLFLPNPYPASIAGKIMFSIEWVNAALSANLAEWLEIDDLVYYPQ